MPNEEEMSDVTPHMNIHSLKIRVTPEKGRGVYGKSRLDPLYHIVGNFDTHKPILASQDISRGTAVEISPVILFSREEYEAHGRFTILDHYTFVWGDGRMALPLGLGKYRLCHTFE